MKRIQWYRGMRDKEGRPAKLPAGAKSAMRPRVVGNPYVLLEQGGSYTREESLRLYKEEYLRHLVAHHRDKLEELRGVDLACRCPPNLPCHVDILLAWYKQN